MLIYRKLNPEKNSFAIDFSSSTLRLAKIEKSKTQFDVTSLGEVAYNNRVFLNNKVEDEGALASNIKHLVTNTEGEKIKTKFVSLSISEEKAFIKVIKLPKISKKDLFSAVFYEAENHLPLPLEELYFDYKIIDSLSDNSSSWQYILIVAAPKRIIGPYINSVEKAGFFPVSLEINVFSLVRFLATEYINDEISLLIKLTSEKITYIICTNQVIWFTFSSPISENEKNNEGALQDKLSREGEKYIKYFEKRSQEEWSFEMKISKVVLCFEDYNMYYNFENFNKRVGIDVAVVKESSKARNDFSAFNNKKNNFFTVLGLAMKHLIE